MKRQPAVRELFLYSAPLFIAPLSILSPGWLVALDLDPMRVGGLSVWVRWGESFLSAYGSWCGVVGTPLSGTVFAINADGTGFTTLYALAPLPDAGGPPYTNSDGAYPRSGLILTGNTLYGTASQGGSFGAGTVFSLSLPTPPKLTITRSGADVILTWQTNVAGFALQSTTNTAFPNSWSPVVQPTITNNSAISVTFPVAGGSKFFRLQSL